MLTYSLGQEQCPAGYQYDPIEQQCVPVEMASLTALRTEAAVQAAVTPTPFTPTAPTAPIVPTVAPTVPTAPSVPIDPYAPTDPYAPIVPAAPVDLVIPPVLVPPLALEERAGWKWWYWLLLAGGVGGTGALLYYGFRRPASTGLRGSGERIKIEYGVTKTPKGWVPTYWLNGRNRGTSWHGVFDKDEALKLAKRDARKEADHYSGDWDITVRKRR